MNSFVNKGESLFFWKQVKLAQLILRHFAELRDIQRWISMGYQVAQAFNHAEAHIVVRGQQ